MKKTIALLSICCLSVLTYAQEIFPYNQISYFKNNTYKSVRFSQKNIYERVSLIKNKHHKVRIELYTKFSENGNRLIYENRTAHKKEINVWENDSQMLHTTRLKNGDTLTFNKYTYIPNSSYIVSNQTFVKGSSKLKKGVYWAYNDLDKLAKEEHINYKKNGEPKVISRFEYSYWENGQKKETKFFNHKNKLMYVYSYACDTKGEVLASNAATVNYCTSKGANADGTFYEVMEIKENGKINRQVYTYTPDSNLVKFERFNLKGKRISFTEYTYNSKQAIESYAYYNKHAKLRYKAVNTYNAEGLKTKEEKFNRHNKFIGSTEISYTYHKNAVPN